MTQIDKLLAVAVGELGTAETPLGSNNVKYNSEQGFASAAWCCAFARWCFHKAGLEDLWKTIEWEGKKTAYCPYAASAAKRAKQWLTSDYRRGDVVFFDWDGNGSADHVGIVESVGDNGTLTTIEGNVSDKVSRCTRKLDKSILGAWRPQYEQSALNAALKILLDKGIINAPEHWRTAAETGASPHIGTLF